MQYALKHLFCQVEMNTDAVWRVGSKAPLLITSGLCQRTIRSPFTRTYVGPISGKLLPLQSPAWRPVTLRVSLKRYSRFTPPGLGEHSLHFRTINIQFIPVSPLPIALPGFAFENTGKHRRGGCVERGTKEGNETKKEINTFEINEAFGGWCELQRKSFLSKVTQTVL